jgi:hypothetical protein
MAHSLASTIQQPYRALVVLLHPDDSAEPARRLAQAWRPIVPTAQVAALSVSCDGVGTAQAQLSTLLDAAHLGRQRLVLVGICGAEGIALQLAYSRSVPICGGILACGAILPPLTPLAASNGNHDVRLRLVWDVRDPLTAAAALGALLQWFRADGVDAQGTVLEQEGASSACHPDNDVMSPAVTRMGGAYLAELVAIALGAARAGCARG